MPRTTPHDKHADYDKQIRSHADKAFEIADTKPELREEGKKSHDQLFGWLMDIHAKSIKPESFVTEGMVDLVAQTIIDGTPGNDEHAIDKATVRKALEKLFATTFAQGATLSRQNEDRPWEQTGFFSDPKGAKAVFAKVGKDLYQPMGFDDGDCYLPIEVSKMLWARQFALAFVVPIPGAFLIEKTAKPAEAPEIDPVLLEVMKVCHTDISEELDGYMKARSGTDEEKKEADFRLRETIKLCRIRYKALDDKMDMVIADRPEFGKNFENANIGEVAAACLEFMAFMIDSFTVKGTIQETSLVIPKPDENSVPLLKRIEKNLKAALDSPQQDGDYIASIIAAACTAYPPLRLKLDELSDKTSIVDAARVLLETMNDNT